MNEGTKVLIGFLGFFAEVAVMGIHGCDVDHKHDGQKAAVQVEYIKLQAACVASGHSTLECKALVLP